MPEASRSLWIPALLEWCKFQNYWPLHNATQRIVQSIRTTALLSMRKARTKYHRKSHQAPCRIGEHRLVPRRRFEFLPGDRHLTRKTSENKWTKIHWNRILVRVCLWNAQPWMSYTAAKYGRKHWCHESPFNLDLLVLVFSWPFFELMKGWGNVRPKLSPPRVATCGISQAAELLLFLT